MPRPSTRERVSTSLSTFGGDKPLGPLLTEEGRVESLLPRLVQQVQAEGGRLHHRGYTHGDDGNPQVFLIQGHSGVAHPGAGDNAGVRDLDRPAHPLLPAGGQASTAMRAGGL